MAEDRPIIVSGGDQMVTVKLPPSTKPNGGGAHTLEALQAAGPFKTIEFWNDSTNQIEFSTPLSGEWRIIIE